MLNFKRKFFNEICGDDYIQFTMEVWDPKKELTEASNDVPNKVEACK